MITKISGRLSQVDLASVAISVGAFEHEVLVSGLVRQQLQGQLEQEVSLHTIEYLEGNPAHGRLVPRLVGFLTEAERDFFDLFTSVDGMGVKKALKALARPVREIATAIERQDAATLATLPGVGAAMADRIIAKLRRKVPQFALMVTRGTAAESDVAEPSVVDEAYAALQAVGHTAADAQRLLDQVLAGKKKKYKDVGELLLAVWDQSGT
jgi:Holliday junction DNA helicase RuvA